VDDCKNVALKLAEHIIREGLVPFAGEQLKVFIHELDKLRAHELTEIFQVDALK
jgi:hypothetical protein